MIRPDGLGVPYRLQSRWNGEWMDFGPWIKGAAALEALRPSLVGSGWRVLKGIGQGTWTTVEAW